MFYEPASSSSEDEDSRDQRQLKGIPCRNSRCDQEIVCINDRDYFCSRDCYYSKLDSDKIREPGIGIQVRRITIKGRGGTGLLRDRSQLDHLMIKIDDVIGRVVTIHNSGIRASLWKRDSKKGKPFPEKQTNEDTKRKTNNEDKRRLKELLNFSGSDTSDDEQISSEDDDKEKTQVHEEAHEEIRSRLSSGVNSSVCPVHPPVGKKGARVQGYVINIVSPWELYIQTKEMIRMTEEINKICNRPEGIDSRLSVPMWLPEVGGYCAAKYEGQLYRAKILNKIDDNLQVKYIDYGNVGIVSQADVFQLNPEITLIPRQYFFFKMSNVKPKNSDKIWSAEVCQFLVDHLDGGVVELEIECVERGVIHWGILYVKSSLVGDIKGNFGQVLVEKQLAEPDTFYI